ncbi:hypothetical protein EDD15DRAFT_2521764, partial [Pisolithus albus]
MFVVSSSRRIVLCAPQRSSRHRHRSVSRSTPHKKYYRCSWAVLDNVCGVHVPGELFSVHLREAHVIGISIFVAMVHGMLHVRYAYARVVLILVHFASLPSYKKYYQCG